MAQVIKIDGAYKLPDDVLNQPQGSRFDFIFANGVWKRSTGGESVSGTGSMMTNTVLYRNQLGQYISSFKGDRLKFFDAPCGDLNWIKEFFLNVDYIGGDISGDLIEHLRKKYPTVDLHKFDITTDRFPDADVWHCRHCLFHLSLPDIFLALENFSASKISNALITNQFLPDSVTFDIPTGSFRPLDLTNYPFYLPRSKMWLLDSEPLSGKLAMATGVWTRKEIQQGVQNYKKFIK